MYTLMNGQIKVKCIKKNKYGLVLGKIYDAFYVKSPITNKEKIISVIDDFGDEYAYPVDLFEVIDGEKNSLS